MKSSISHILRLGWVLLILMVASIALVAVDQPNGDVVPSASSYEPSGMAAATHLLEKLGYKVSSGVDVPSQLAPGALLITFKELGPWSFGGRIDQGAMQAADAENNQLIHKHAMAGGNTLIFGETSASMPTAPPTTDATEPSGKHYTVVASNLDPDPYSDSGNEPGISGYLQKSGIATYQKLHSGWVVTVSSVLPATNYYIASDNDAQWLADTVATLVKPGGEIYIDEAPLYGAAPPNLLDLLGPWSRGFVYQGLALLAVIVFTLGIRFGMPGESRTIQRSSRELVDGISDFFMRKRAGKQALQQLYLRIDLDLRKHFGLPLAGQKEQRDRSLPPEVAIALRNVELGLLQPLDVDQATYLARQLELTTAPILRRRKGRRVIPPQ